MGADGTEGRTEPLRIRSWVEWEGVDVNPAMEWLNVILCGSAFHSSLLSLSPPLLSFSPPLLSLSPPLLTNTLSNKHTTRLQANYDLHNEAP